MIPNSLIVPPIPPVTSLTVSCISPECIGPELMVCTTGFTSAAWTANRLLAIPLLLTRPYLVNQFFWYNGATAAGNTDVGIYNEAGTTKFGSTGSTANSGTSQIQAVDSTDFYLGANQRYWLVMGCDSGTQTFQRMNPGVGLMDYLGVKEQLSGWSSGLPSSLTLAVPTVAYIPFFGFGRSVV